MTDHQLAMNTRNIGTSLLTIVSFIWVDTDWGTEKGTDRTSLTIHFVALNKVPRFLSSRKNSDKPQSAINNLIEEFSYSQFSFYFPGGHCVVASRHNILLGNNCCARLWCTVVVSQTTRLLLPSCKHSILKALLPSQHASLVPLPMWHITGYSKATWKTIMACKL